MKKSKLILAMQESYDELRYKTSWPTRSQVVKSALIVLVAAAIIALVVLVVMLSQRRCWSCWSCSPSRREALLELLSMIPISEPTRLGEMSSADGGVKKEKGGRVGGG
ncbi:MAG: preprotein translocase subunit SecE, partial [Muribaculaceae bacterium]|nr:preprotein translocase subunit SecE [Muribaculaceae bacterium]